MRGGGGGRRRAANEPSFLERAPLSTDPPTRQLSLTMTSNRDSDASLYSGRHSVSSRSISTTTDRSHQASIRAINDYLSSISSPVFLKTPLPSAKDITDAIRILFNRLDWPSSSSTPIKLDEDLPLLLKHLNCPIKFQKSALKAPSAPHAWPSLLAVIHWLVQISLYNDHVSASSSSTSTTRSFLHSNRILVYALESYTHYIRGDDDAVLALEREFESKLGQETVSADEKVGFLEREVARLQEKLDGMRSAPPAKEVLEKEKSVLEDDVSKFHALIDNFKSGIAMMEKGLEEKEKELEAKIQENRRTCEENEDLKKKADAQTVNLRDAERMKREILALERDIAEAEVARNGWEEKSWDIDATLAHKLKELESLSIECNQAIRRLKLGNNLQFMLNPKGATAAEVLGLDYKSTLQPTLNAFVDDVKKSSETQLEELISLQQHSRENASRHDGKRNTLTKLQAQIDAVESQLSLMKKELEELIRRCDLEAKIMVEDVERERCNLEMMEREAEDCMKISSSKLEEVIKQSDEEIQMCESELLSLVDSVSKYKEYMGSIISEMKRNLSGTAGAVANAYEGSLATEVGVSVLVNDSQ